jgi:hypothetical protein
MSQINDAFGRPLYDAMRGTPPPTWEQTCLDLDKKLADSRQHVTELENRLRALWDKLEYERKHYMERISELEKLGDTLANCTSDNPYNARYAEQWWDLRGIKHE